MTLTNEEKLSVFYMRALRGVQSLCRAGGAASTLVSAIERYVTDILAEPEPSAVQKVTADIEAVESVTDRARTLIHALEPFCGFENRVEKSDGERAMTIDREALKRLAEAATPPRPDGLWDCCVTEAEDEEDGYWCSGPTSYDHDQARKDRDYSSAANPAAILELLAELEKAEEAAEAALATANGYREACDKAEDALAGEREEKRLIALRCAGAEQRLEKAEAKLSERWSCGHARYPVALESHPECAECYKAERDEPFGCDAYRIARARVRAARAVKP